MGLVDFFPGAPSLLSECVRQIAFRATSILIDEDPKRKDN